jgi:hypothetical protein
VRYAANMVRSYSLPPAWWRREYATPVALRVHAVFEVCRRSALNAGRKRLGGPPKVSHRMLDAERCRRFNERRERLSAAVLWAAIGAVTR